MVGNTKQKHATDRKGTHYCRWHWIDQPMHSVVASPSKLLTCNIAFAMHSSPFSKSAQLWQAEIFLHLSSLSSTEKVQVLCEDLHSQIPSLCHVPLQNLPKKKTFNIKHKNLNGKMFNIKIQTPA